MDPDKTITKGKGNEGRGGEEKDRKKKREDGRKNLGV